MARAVHHHSERRPSRRLRDDVDGYFFPGEVARLLRLEGIDYHQLRKLWELIRSQRGEESSVRKRAWARYSLADLACLENVLGAVGDRDALRPGRRLRLAGIEEACEALRRRGFRDPLLEVRLTRQGRTVLAMIDGALIDPRTGQQTLAETDLRVREFLDAREVPEPGLRRALSAERQRRRSQAQIGLRASVPVE